MAVVFDTETVPIKDRAERLRVALAETSVSSVALLQHDAPVDARLEVWQLGGSYLFRADTSAVRMFRTPRQAMQEPVPLLALAVQERGAGSHRQFGPLRQVRPGSLMGMDMTEEFEFSWSAQGASRAFMMPLEQLDVSTDLLRHAEPNLTQSPLYRLVAAHIVELFDAADALSTHPAAADVARSSVDLARALVTSLSADAATRREAAAQTLLMRVREYVRLNLRDPDLAAASIAQAHHISVRHLYSVCSAAGISLEQHIIRCRLRAIHDELSLPAIGRRSIESVAYGWGFRNVSHFTRRFSAEFGVSPRERRAASTAARDHAPGLGR